MPPYDAKRRALTGYSCMPHTDYYLISSLVLYLIAAKIATGVISLAAPSSYLMFFKRYEVMWKWIFLFG